MKPGLTVVKEQKSADDALADIRQRAKERQAQDKTRGRDDDPGRGR